MLQYSSSDLKVFRFCASWLEGHLRAWDNISGGCNERWNNALYYSLAPKRAKFSKKSSVIREETFNLIFSGTRVSQVFRVEIEQRRELGKESE